MEASERRRRLRKSGLHCVRVSLFVAVILLIHLEHARTVSTDRSRPIAAVPLDRVRAFFPEAVSIDDVPAAHDGLDVLDASRRKLGHVIRTSPVSDSILGFSGPTDVLVAFGSDQKIVGLAILASEDTRDHVEAVRDDPAFPGWFSGLTREEAVRRTDLDAVSGATLTSRAIQEAVIRRLGGKRKSLRFGDRVTAVETRGLFPTAASLADDTRDPSRRRVLNASGAELGTVVRTSPFADDVVGYQGPTDTFIGFDVSGRIVGIALRRSYDNEPYVSYVREDEHFNALFVGLLLEDLARLDLDEAEIEGVSGATMTSLAVARSLVRAAVAYRAAQAAQSRNAAVSLSFHDVGAALTIVAGLMVGLTRLRARRFARIALQLILVGYLGLTAGILLSQASLVGWAQNGVPWRTAPGFVLLTAAALLLPITARRNLYCSHLCPHGAAQQLLRRRLPRRWRIRPGRRLVRLLSLVPVFLLGWCVLVAMGSLAFDLVDLVDLVDLEPFDAWVFRVAGPATVTVAIVGLAASLFVPMAYCRFGCPTGALLGFLKLDARSGLWTRRDWLAVALVTVAVCVYFV